MPSDLPSPISDLRSAITPLVLTFNEAPNIGRTLEKLAWAREVIVLDSFSTDETIAIVGSFPNARVIQRKFENHTDQWNFGLDQIKSDWVLSLDADYILTGQFVTEIQNLPSPQDIDAYYAPFQYCINGHPLRACLYPPRAVLFRRERCRYIPDGHTQKLKIPGKTSMFSSFILHDDRKALSHWFAAQDRYAILEAHHMTSDIPPPSFDFSLPDRFRRAVVFAPAVVFLYTLFAKRLILDGWPGLFYVFQRTLAELLLSLRLIEAKLRKRP